MELQRVVEFRSRVDEGAVDELRPWSGGTALLTPRLPKVWDANYFRLDHPEAVDAEAIAAEASAVAAAAGVSHAAIVVTDEPAATRLAPVLRELGFEVTRLVAMALRELPDPPDRTVVRASFAEVAASRREITREFFSGDDELADQLRELDRRLEATIGGDWFAIREQGEIVARAWLLRDGPIAQIEDVATTRNARGRGLARAVVSAAAHAAIDGGAELTFLVADADETTPTMYRKLGFEPLGVTYRFVRPTGT